MEIKEFLIHRTYLLEESTDENGFIYESSFLKTCLPYLNDTKLIDTDDFNESYCYIGNMQLKINGYIFNESGERLQLLVVNEESVSPAVAEADLIISQKQVYEKLFSRAVNFVKKSAKKQLQDELQDSSQAKILSVLLGSAEGLQDIDVVEIFLISATATVESRGEAPKPRQIEFEEEEIQVSYTDSNKKKVQKEITIIRRLIDMNFLYNVAISQGNREPLTVDFTSYRVDCIQAASEENYESYLCVLPATLLAELYKKYSSRMLEKNVRSFLQLNNSVNKGIQETIRRSPEKFIAYNNGLTITATGKKLITESGRTYIGSLTDFQIVNGGQTTATIYFSKKAGLDIGRVKVMAKVNVAKDASEDELDDLISRISAYSNAQSRVSPVDLRSRNSQLVKLKSLSESVVTPSGKKWFFERAKGEFSTLIRKSPQHKARINREYPKERRFTKEELAKYYTAWGEAPYLVKKGGEKVFRLFIEEIAGDGKSKKPARIDRGFYEELIGRIILFRSLENLYGTGNRAIGQIRSAVVPYVIAVLYKYTAREKGSAAFDLFQLWKNEGLDGEFSNLMVDLMKLMNELIKKYAESDDYGEYSKKQELWNVISTCKEIEAFVKRDDFKAVVKKYSTARKDNRGTDKKKDSGKEVDFEPLYSAVRIVSKTSAFYKQVLTVFSDSLKAGEIHKLEQIIAAINNKEDIQPQYFEFENTLLDKIRIVNPGFFDSVNYEEDVSLRNSLDFIVKKYNDSVANNEDIVSKFNAIKQLATAKKAKYPPVFDEIGRALVEGNLPALEQVRTAANYVDLITKKEQD